MYTTENSLISAMALLCVIASTHFWSATDIDADLYRDVKERSDGVQLLFDLVSKVYTNAPIFIVYPDLVFPTDDTVQYIFEGKGKTKHAFTLASNLTERQAGTRVKYVILTSNLMSGMRVKLTYTFLQQELQHMF